MAGSAGRSWCTRARRAWSPTAVDDKCHHGAPGDMLDSPMEMQSNREVLWLLPACRCGVLAVVLRPRRGVGHLALEAVSARDVRSFRAWTVGLRYCGRARPWRTARPGAASTFYLLFGLHLAFYRTPLQASEPVRHRFKIEISQKRIKIFSQSMIPSRTLNERKTRPQRDHMREGHLSRRLLSRKRKALV